MWQVSSSGSPGYTILTSRTHSLPFCVMWGNIDGLVQERRNSSVLAISCINPSIYWTVHVMFTVVKLIAYKNTQNSWHSWPFVRKPSVTGLPPQRVINGALWCFICCWYGHIEEKTVDLKVMYDALMLIWHHCNATWWNSYPHQFHWVASIPKVCGQLLVQ